MIYLIILSIAFIISLHAFFFYLDKRDFDKEMQQRKLHYQATGRRLKHSSSLKIK